MKKKHMFFTHDVLGPKKKKIHHQQEDIGGVKFRLVTRSWGQNAFEKWTSTLPTHGIPREAFYEMGFLGVRALRRSCKSPAFFCMTSPSPQPLSVLINRCREWCETTVETLGKLCPLWTPQLYGFVHEAQHAVYLFMPLPVDVIRMAALRLQMSPPTKPWAFRYGLHVPNARVPSAMDAGMRMVVSPDRSGDSTHNYSMEELRAATFAIMPSTRTRISPADADRLVFSILPSPSTAAVVHECATNQMDEFRSALRALGNGSALSKKAWSFVTEEAVACALETTSYQLQRAQIDPDLIATVSVHTLVDRIRLTAMNLLVQAGKTEKTRRMAARIWRTPDAVVPKLLFCEKDDEGKKILAVLLSLTLAEDSCCMDVLASVQLLKKEAGVTVRLQDPDSLRDLLQRPANGEEDLPDLVSKRRTRAAVAESLGAIVLALHLLGNPDNICSLAAKNVLEALKRRGGKGVGPDSRNLSDLYPEPTTPSSQIPKSVPAPKAPEPSSPQGLFDGFGSPSIQPPVRFRAGTRAMCMAAFERKEVASTVLSRGIRVFKCKRVVALAPGSEAAKDWLSVDPRIVGCAGAVGASAMVPDGLHAGILTLFPGGGVRLSEDACSVCLRAVLKSNTFTFRVGREAMVCVNRARGAKILMEVGGEPPGFEMSTKRYQEGAHVRMVLRFTTARTTAIRLVVPSELSRGGLLEIHRLGDNNWLQHEPLSAPLIVRPIALSFSPTTFKDSFGSDLFEEEYDFFTKTGCYDNDEVVGIVCSERQAPNLQSKLGGLFVCFPLDLRPSWMLHDNKTHRLLVKDRAKRMELQTLLKHELRDNYRVYVRQHQHHPLLAVVWLGLPRWWANQRLSLPSPPPCEDPLNHGLAIAKKLI